jgi:hypothetical protein
MKEVLKAILSNMDKGFYREARKQDVPLAGYAYLSRQMADKGLYPSEDEMVSRVKALAVSLGYPADTANKVSPMARQKLEDFAYQTWALERAFAEQGIRVKGAGADRLEKFFATTSSAVLFPAYVETQIIMGMLADAILSDLVAVETNIDSDTYRGLNWTDVEADQQLKEVLEGAKLPTTKITTADTVVYVKKFGRMLEATYEALRRQQINVVSLMLQRIGQRMQLDETDWAIQTLIAGDGNTGSAITNANDIDADVQGTLDYDELTKLYLAFGSGYQMTTAVCRQANIRTILNMSEFKDPMAGFSFQRNGVLPGPMGATWRRWDSTGATAFTALSVLAIDSRYALQQVTEQGVTTEADRLIDCQIERTAISKTSGFKKLDYAAVQVLDVNAEI